jgi:hypothetical protein
MVNRFVSIATGLPHNGENGLRCKCIITDPADQPLGYTVLRPTDRRNGAAYIVKFAEAGFLHAKTLSHRLTPLV